jgi:tRNA pseudouridine13 synthase
MEATFEESVGICAFSNSSPGVQGILKQRFSDFVVREITTEGEVVVLKSIVADRSLAEEEKASAEPQPVTVQVLNATRLDNLLRDIKEAKSAAGDSLDLSCESEFREFIELCITRSPDAPLDFVAFPLADKALRTAVHQITKANVALFVDTNTVQVEGVTNIRFIARHKRKENNEPVIERAKNTWDSTKGNYLKFTLLKENIDTMSAIASLSKSLRIKTNGIEYSGTKDKRGVTTQICTVYRRKPADFQGMNRYKGFPTIRVGDFSYVEKPVSLGAICGNQFEIVLRDVALEESHIVAACKAMGQSGFINYFGLQRFGKGGSKSHDIGKAVIKSEWQTCIDMLFADRVGDKLEFSKAKTLYQNKQYKEALRFMPDSMYSEKLVLKKLISNPSDVLGAYNAMPKNTRLLCMHAYQSYIWNMAVTKRLQQYGMQCVVGDLVATNAAVLKYDDETSDAEESTTDHIEKPSVSVEAAATEGGVAGNDFQMAKYTKSNKDAIRHITQEDIDSNTFSIGDVILPLPGYDSILPGNDIGAYILEMLAVDGLTLDSYRECNITYRLSGAYRRMVQQPKDFQWSVLRYDDPQAELATTELTLFRTDTRAPAIPPAAPIVTATSDNVVDSTDSSASSSVPSSSSPSTDRGSVGRFQALRCKFQLPPGTYATMLLRELTKESTETQYQSQLTSAHQLKSSAGSKAPPASTTNGPAAGGTEAASESLKEDSEEPAAKVAKCV